MDKIDLKKKIINVCEPKLTNKAKKYVLDCIESEWVSSSGKYLDEFEKKWSSYCGAKEGISVTSGTTALQVSFKSLNLKSGDEVIMPSFTIISCAMAIIEAGGTPILVDCDLKDWNMIPEEVINKISKKTKAIIITHIYGFPVNLNKILYIVSK